MDYQSTYLIDKKYTSGKVVNSHFYKHEENNVLDTIHPPLLPLRKSKSQASWLATKVSLDQQILLMDLINKIVNFLKLYYPKCLQENIELTENPLTYSVCVLALNLINKQSERFIICEDVHGGKIIINRINSLKDRVTKYQPQLLVHKSLYNLLESFQRAYITECKKLGEPHGN